MIFLQSLNSGLWYKYIQYLVGFGDESCNLGWFDNLDLDGRHALFLN